eukprot:3677722-Alexandrium_andersonii.AAC.1
MWVLRALQAHGGGLLPGLLGFAVRPLEHLEVLRQGAWVPVLISRGLTANGGRVHGQVRGGQGWEVARGNLGPGGEVQVGVAGMGASRLDVPDREGPLDVLPVGRPPGRRGLQG